MEDARRGWFLPMLSIVLALALSVVPLPDALAPARPPWVPVVLLYWTLLSPRRFGLLTAFWAGLALDTLTGALLGQHALALLLVVYLSQRFYLRLRVFPFSQLVLAAAVLLGLYEFMLFWVDGVAGPTVPAVYRWAPVASGTAVWIVALVHFERGRQQAPVRL